MARFSFRHPGWMIAASALLLMWPAFYNGYPLVFADSGTYVASIVHGWVGWDRPIFYGLFLFVTHLTVSTWPCVAVQCLVTAWVLHLTRRAFFPDSWPLPALALGLSVCTALPWFAAELMPDLFTGLLALLLAALILAPDRLSRMELWAVPLAAVAMTSFHLSHLLLSAGMIAVLVPLRGLLGARAGFGWRGFARVAVIPLATVLAWSSVNLIAHGRFAPSPYGNVFLLARILYDGPGLDAIERDCPQAGWRLCAYVGQFPEDSDAFLWRPSSPFYGIGGGLETGKEATSIIVAAVSEEPFREIGVLAHNTWRQMTRFATGDGLEVWPTAVKPWIVDDFPGFESRGYLASLQTNATLVIPGWMQALHAGAALAGILLCAIGGLVYRRHSALQVAVLVALLGNAAITGGLSGPHDRYQSRVMWLPSFVLAMMVTSVLARSPAPLGPRLARPAA